jgi:hypothetical protein
MTDTYPPESLPPRRAGVIKKERKEEDNIENIAVISQLAENALDNKKSGAYFLQLLRRRPCYICSRNNADYFCRFFPDKKEAAGEVSPTAFIGKEKKGKKKNYEENNIGNFT